MIGKHRDKNVVVRDWAETQVTDAGLKHLKGLTNLKKLFLYGTPITDVDLEHPKALVNIYTPPIIVILALCT